MSDIEVRHMLGRAHRIRPDRTPGRWVVDTRLRHRSWEVIVEPDPDTRTLVIVTAYPIP